VLITGETPGGAGASAPRAPESPGFEILESEPAPAPPLVYTRAPVSVESELRATAARCRGRAL